MEKGEKNHLIEALTRAEPHGLGEHVFQTYMQKWLESGDAKVSAELALQHWEIT